MGFFESFSAPFMMSVALWPLVSFIVTVPVLAMLYHRDTGSASVRRCRRTRRCCI